MRFVTTRYRGFTIVEILVAAIILAILVVALAPMTMKIVAARKAEATRDELRDIHRAIVGTPQNGYYGFLGDMGQMPARLEQLVDGKGLPVQSTTTVGKVGIGWNGPYIGRSTDDLLHDAFGGRYELKANGQIVSPGPDGTLGTDDDMTEPARPYKSTGDIHIELLPKAGPYTVRLHYSNGGREQHVEADRQPYLFENANRGPHAVVVMNKTVDPPQIVAQDVIVLAEPSGYFMVSVNP